ncbi:pre-rRNA-processing protein TSR2, putative [Plasmodium gaboni]|uniref:Pre-rRNA-processing protein TSR2, putative n=1 Tax=Plasmodium gaboni TaxID=647221 RepID=A0ABY1UGP2_9APIC|nr:pre-rRNA-processing protein TSR2, putative [Plasmodium gaboni]
MNDDNTLALLYEGINLIFNKWTILRLAVTNNWGGINSEEKKKKLIDYVHNFVTNNNAKNKLCDYLRDEMSVLFNVDIEDDSDIEIADLILDLYQNLKKKNYDILEKIKNIQVYDISCSQEKNLIQTYENEDEENMDDDYSSSNDNEYSNEESSDKE